MVLHVYREYACNMHGCLVTCAKEIIMLIVYYNACLLEFSFTVVLKNSSKNIMLFVQEYFFCVSQAK
jgi:hypothetical protein